MTTGFTSTRHPACLPYAWPRPAAADPPLGADTVPGYEASIWFGLGEPRNVPTGIVETLNTEINAGFADPKMRGAPRGTWRLGACGLVR